MFVRESGVAIAWLLLFILLVSATVYDRAFKSTARTAEIVALG